MTEPIEWMTTGQTATALSIGLATAVTWARIGKLAGSAKDDRGAWLVRRSEVDRVSKSGYGPADGEGHHA